MFEGYLLEALPAIISGITLLVVGWMAKQISGFRAEHKTLMESQRNQLKAAIVEIYEKASRRGYITHMELDTLNRMADSYFALGGNHYIHAVVDCANSMQIKGVKIPS